jgi:cell division septation protein DedD
MNMHNRGTATKPSDADRARVHAMKSPATRGGEFKAQVGAFRFKENADAQCQSLVDQGFSFVVEREKGPSGHDLFFCRSDRTYPQAQAKEMLERLHREIAAAEAIITPVPRRSSVVKPLLRREAYARAARHAPARRSRKSRSRAT